MFTLEHGICPPPVLPSWASDTLTVKATVEFQSKNPPSTGAVMVTTGRVLPTTMGTLATAVFESLSRTVSFAVNDPLLVYWNEGLASVESVDPLLVKSHS